MDFAWSDQQRELLDAVGHFASQQLNYNMIENDRDGVFNRDAWKKCGAFGVQGLLVPAEYGGLGMDPLTAVAALECLAYGCRDNGLLFSINAHMWTAITPLVYSGTEAQKKKYLPGRSVESAGFSSQAAAADYAEAVPLDLKFALAWARLAVQRSLLYFHGADPRTDSAAAVKEAADQAIPS